MDARSIGVFDSGLGGISVLRDIVELMPCENYIYFGDSAHAPYGTKTREAILERSEQCTNFLLAKDVKAIVIACNTATSVAASTLRQQYPSIHYPFVEKVIQRIAGPDVKIFNGAHGTALELQRRLRIAELLTPSIEKGTVEFYSSSTNPETIKLCHQLFEA